MQRLQKKFIMQRFLFEAARSSCTLLTQAPSLSIFWVIIRLLVSQFRIPQGELHFSLSALHNRANHKLRFSCKIGGWSAKYYNKKLGNYVKAYVGEK